MNDEESINNNKRHQDNKECHLPSGLPNVEEKETEDNVKIGIKVQRYLVQKSKEDLEVRTDDERRETEDKVVLDIRTQRHLPLKSHENLKDNIETENA